MAKGVATNNQYPLFLAVMVFLVFPKVHYGLEAAQVILGHSQANITQVYAERDLAKGVEVAKLIG